MSIPITLIAGNAFAGCTSLTSVYYNGTIIPNVASNAFAKCSSDLKIYVTENYEDDYFAGREVASKRLTDDNVVVSAVTHNGEKQNPTIVVNNKELVSSTDYEITWTGDYDFTSAGDYTITIKGINNYRGTIDKTFTIEKATPTLTVTSPVKYVLPGNTISLTITAEESEVTEFKIEDGTNYEVDGYKIKISENAVIGQDKITIKVTSESTTNYKAVEETIELIVGTADYSGDIEKLNEAIKDLQSQIDSNDIDIETLNESIKK